MVNDEVILMKLTNLKQYETFEKLSYKSLRGAKRRGNLLYFQ